MGVTMPQGDKPVAARVSVLTPAERRMAESRAELAAILTPGPDDFPRSLTMRFLTAGRGKMVMLGVVGGMMLVKPKLAMGLVRFLPLGKYLPVIRMLQSLR
jgi:hypothetical protein